MDEDIERESVVEPTPPSSEDGPQYPVNESVLQKVSHPVGEDSDESSTK